MEGSDLSQLGNSLRVSTSSIWRDNGVGPFPSSNGGYRNEEELLKWAEIERLPTQNRLKKGILVSPEGEADEIEVDKLGFEEKRDLIERLVKDPEEDNEKFLLKLRRRLDRVGIVVPTLEVRFKDLKVEAQAKSESRALPSFTNFTINLLEGYLQSLHLSSSLKTRLNILQNVSGIIKPGRLTLLLGPPASGKTTLLLALAGKLDKNLEFSGKVTYNGCELNEFVPQRNVAYISQHDLHIAEMTVRETLSFSARCQGVGSRYEMLAELSRREKEANIIPDPDLDIFMKALSTKGQESNVITEYVLKVLGLEICADTMVGDEMVRGISGGQRKRLTTGEMLVGPVKVLLMDEISTGLDSATTYQIVTNLKQYIHILKGTAVISLLQPPPETYDLFDDIILLSDGLVVYQGPSENVLEFFESMGFRCPIRKGVADFLQEVTSRKDQQQYWALEDKPYRFVSAKEFAEAFQSFHVGSILKDELANPIHKSSDELPHLVTKKYSLSEMELFKACFSRQCLLIKRNSIIYIFKILQLTIVGILGSTLFLRTNMHRDTLIDGQIFMGALFFTVLSVMFNGTAEMGLTIFKLPVFYKQRDLLFFPAWAYALPTWLLRFPMSIVEVGIFISFTYYVIGYDPSVERFFKQFLLLVLLNQMASGLFRFVASVGRNIVVSATLASFVMLVLFINCGFILTRDKVKSWWIWGYWISPIMYAENAIATNEFLGDSWDHVVKPQNEPLGVAVLEYRSFFHKAYWYWIGVGGLIGFQLLFNFGFIIALTFLNTYEKQQAVISESVNAEEHYRSSHGTVELTQQDRGAEISSTAAATQERKKGMILPFEPLYLTFNEITYSVDVSKEMKAIGFHEDKLVLLRNVSGSFRPGILTALMGVSGAGKTTLMDVLAGRKTGGYIEGNISISGYPKKQETFARVSGYCEQNDIHSPHVTVHESLIYSSTLRLSRDVDTKTRKMFIDEVMELVELEPLRGAIVGLPGVNGLSIEQRKRLTIAVELVANPAIIFMDEPTSGLDARAAAIVMRTVRNTVDTGRTVVCTIHQPSIDIFEAFDELFLLKRGGETIYFGPLGHNSCELINYFEGIEGVSKIKEGVNPATWMLEVTTPGQAAVLGVDFADIYKNSELYRRNKEFIQELSVPASGSKELHFDTQFAQSFFSQCRACLWKQRVSYWRNPSYTAIRFYFTVINALVFGTMFWDLGSKKGEVKVLFNAMGSMFCAVLFIGVQNATSAQPVVSIERTVFYRERAAGMYSALPYGLAQVIVEIPYLFVQSVSYSVIVYTMMGFEWTAIKFLWYFFFFYFTLMYYTYYGMMTVAVTPNYHLAVVSSSSFYSLWNLFAGFILPRSHMPVWWSWYYWLCPVSWTLYGLFASQYGDREDVLLESGQTVKEFLRSYYGYRHDFLGVAAVVIVAIPVSFAVIFIISIKIFNFQNR